MSAKILIVDDEPNLLRMIGYAFQTEGHEVVIAKEGKEALKKVQTEEPDLIILDVMLPDMSGIEICQRLRNRDATANIPILMLSARAQVSDKVDGLEAGADEYVTKPVEIEEIIARVAALLNRTRRLRESSPTRQKKILAFIGAKGGVGTTTVALNVALALTKPDKVVTAIEMRPNFGTFSQHLGWAPVENLTDLLEIEAERIDERELKLRLANHSSGMQVLFGPQTVSNFKAIHPELAEILTKGLARLSDYAIIDLPNYPSAANHATLRQCDLITLVVEPEPSAVMSGKVTLELLKSWGVGGKLAGAVVVNRTATSAPMKISDIGSKLGCKVIRVIPPAPEACARAYELGSPIVLSQPKSIMANALIELAGRLATDRMFATEI